MYKAAAAINTFLNGFGLSAYTEDTVPEGEQLPYITYSFTMPEWNRKGSLYIQVWDRTKSNTGIIRIADQITAAIGEKKKINLDGGYLVIWPDNSQGQIMVDGDFRYAYLNFSINAYNLPGV